MIDRVLNVGLIGAGRIGRLHAQHLARRIPRARLAAVADVVLASAMACASEYSAPNAVDDYRRLLEDPAVEAVVVCSATDTHSQIVADAAAAGKHVFCEKPIDLTLERTDATLAGVHQAGVTLQIGFNRRFDANYRRARAAITNAEVGTVWRLHIVSRDPSPPPIEYIRTSGGMFVDMTIHDFDMARFLIGAEVEEVFATARVMVDSAIGTAGDVDTAVTVLRFANGVIGTIDNSRSAAYGYDQRVEIFGSGGMVATSNNYESTAVISDRDSVHRDLPLNFFMQRYTDSYIAEMSAFVDCVLDGGTPPVTGEDGRAALVLGLAAQRSARENRPVRVLSSNA
ncbi:MAG: inositol 2-dehydrogenase [Chloroflexi bacterium]|nr:inositol 2-dehydrogenase [Chloroflexota bacterium]